MGPENPYPKEYQLYEFEFVAPDKVHSTQEILEKLSNFPTRKDVQKILEVAKVAGDGSPELWILDVGGASGFMDKLLIDEARSQGLDLHAIVVDPNKELVRQAGEYYRQTEPNIHFIAGDDDGAKNALAGKKFDLVLNSWMPQNTDLGQNIRQVDAKARVYIGDHIGWEDTATGTAEAYEPGAGFKDFGYWRTLGQFSARTSTSKFTPQGINYPSDDVVVQVPDDLLVRKGQELKEALARVDTSDIPNSELYEWEHNLKYGDEWRQESTNFQEAQSEES